MLVFTRDRTISGAPGVRIFVLILRPRCIIYACIYKGSDHIGSSGSKNICNDFASEMNHMRGFTRDRTISGAPSVKIFVIIMRRCSNIY